MKLPIKVGNKTYYIDSKEYKLLKRFREISEIKFAKNAIRINCITKTSKCI